MGSFAVICRELQSNAGKDDILFSVKDISRAFDVHYTTAQRWTKTPGFPHPVWRGKRPAWTVDGLAGWVMRGERE